MPTIAMPFAGQSLTFDIDERNLIEVLAPAPAQTITDLDGAIANALTAPINQKPLNTLVQPGHKVVIVSDDVTRLTPVYRMIPPLIDLLNKGGIPDHDIVCLIALGTHRYMSEEELITRVGETVWRRIEVRNHCWREEENLVDLGISSQGTPLVVNKEVVEADVVIGLGAIVPHHIAGFSGSSKIIQPGVSGPRTTAETHMLSCSGGDSLLGIADNPVRRDMDDMAARVGMQTIFNVVLDSHGAVAGVFYGEMKAAFTRGVELATAIYGVNYHETPDIVIANAYPCELDFWQSHKALYPAQRMIKQDGTIIVVTPAPEGISPVHTELLDFAGWPSVQIKNGYYDGRLVNGVAAALATAWALVREKAEVIMYSPGIPAADQEKLGFIHADSIESALALAYKRQGDNARVSILTHAPDLLPIAAL